MIHENRAWLAAHGPLRGPLQSLYGALGVTVQPPVNLSAYQLRQWGVTGDPNAAGTLRVRASILNTSAQLQPYPLLRVTLANRFGTQSARATSSPLNTSAGPPRAADPGRARRCDARHPGPRQGCRRLRDRRVPARRPKHRLRGGCCAAGGPRPRRAHPGPVRPRPSHEQAAAHRTLCVALERRARADGGSDRPAVSHAVPPLRRGARRLGDAHRGRAPVGHAEIAAAHGPSRRSRARASCRSPASIRR